MPWVYLEMDTNGDVHPCCMNPRVFGNIKETSLEKIWNGTEMNNFRLSLLKEELPKSCLACKYYENTGTISLRKMYNNIFKDSFPQAIKNTNNNGSLKVIEFKGYKFKISNKCNFKCRMCNEYTSSSFTGKIVSHSQELKFEEFIENNIENLEMIDFAAGETLIMDEHYYLLQKLIDRGKIDVRIEYCTNMSTLKYKSYDVLEYWNKWNPEKLAVAASIDEIGDRAEYIRKGTKWSIIEKNLKLISKQSFIRQVSMVVSCFNVYRLPEIIEYLTDIGYVDPQKFLDEKHKYTNVQLYIVDLAEEFESPLSPWILPKNFKHKTKEKILSFIDNYNVKYFTDISPIFKSVLFSLDIETNENLVKQFLYKNIEMDKDRKENLFKIFPEFVEILDQWKLSGLI